MQYSASFSAAFVIPGRSFIQYKAERAGIPVFLVDPKNTIRTCPTCGHVDKKNRQRSFSERDDFLQQELAPESCRVLIRCSSIFYQQ